MAYTLAEYYKVALQGDDFLRMGIIGNILRGAKAMEVIPWRKVSSLQNIAIRYNTLPTVAFRRINEGYSPNEGMTEQVAESIYGFGGEIKFDRIFKKLNNLVDAPEKTPPSCQGLAGTKILCNSTELLCYTFGVDRTDVLEVTYHEDPDGTKHGTRVLANGAVYDYDRGRIVGHRRDLAIVNTQITSENSSEFKRLRQEKTQALLADQIAAVTADKLNLSPDAGPPEAVAAAGAAIWRDVVLDDTGDVYPRDRLESFKSLAAIAGLVAGAGAVAAQPSTVNILTAEAAAVLLPLLMQARTGAESETVAGEVVEQQNGRTG